MQDPGIFPGWIWGVPLAVVYSQGSCGYSEVYRKLRAFGWNNSPSSTCNTFSCLVQALGQQVRMGPETRLCPDEVSGCCCCCLWTPPGCRGVGAVTHKCSYEQRNSEGVKLLSSTSDLVDLQRNLRIGGFETFPGDGDTAYRHCLGIVISF